MTCLGMTCLGMNDCGQMSQHARWFASREVATLHMLACMEAAVLGNYAEYWATRMHTRSVNVLSPRGMAG